MKQIDASRGNRDGPPARSGHGSPLLATDLGDILSK